MIINCEIIDIPSISITSKNPRSFTFSPSTAPKSTKRIKSVNITYRDLCNLLLIRSSIKITNAPAIAISIGASVIRLRLSKLTLIGCNIT